MLALVGRAVGEVAVQRDLDPAQALPVGRDAVLGDRFHVVAQQHQRRGIGLEGALEHLLHRVVVLLAHALDQRQHREQRVRLEAGLVQELPEAVGVALRLVGGMQQADDLRREGRALGVGLPVVAHGGVVVAPGARQLAQQDVRPGAAGMAAERLARELRRARLLAGGARQFGLLAVVLGDGRLLRDAALALDLDGVADRLLPFLLLLVDLAQVLPRLARVGAGLQQALQHVLGAVEQPGLEVVARQLQQRVGLGLVVQVRAGDQVLVQPDGALDLAAPPHQVADHDVGLDRVGVQVDRVDEQVHGLVRLFVEQVVEALQVVPRDRLGGALLQVAPRRPPAGEGGDRQQQPQQRGHAHASWIGSRRRVRTSSYTRS